MRDDVRQLLEYLITLLENRRSGLEALLHSKIEQRHLLKTDSVRELAELAESDQRRAESIDELDTDITAARERIAGLCGISVLDFERLFHAEGSPCSDELRRLDGEICALLLKISGENDLFLSELGEAFAATGRDIETIGRIIALKGRLGDGGRDG